MMRKDIFSVNSEDPSYLELYPYIKIKVTETCSFMSLGKERWVATGYSYSYGLVLHGSHSSGVMLDE